MKTNIYFLIAMCCFALACNKASVKEEILVMDTYPYSDPDPVVNPANSVYPYFKFDGYAHESTPEKWKGIIMENEHVKVTILPEIGGKIWGAVEKSTGEDFIYYNDVVKFRNIAMRGPWTSGGIEANFGIIGHVPSTSAPVDYTTRENSDGSVSCFIGGLEQLTSTWWSLEVRLEKDKSYFTTSTTWHNTTPLGQPYYHWMNAGFKATKDMTFCFPGYATISHGGESTPWPIDSKGRNLGRYAENDFAGDKSNHVVGQVSDYFGTYWDDTNFGSVHHSDFDEKLGMKVFLWGLSRQGMIWEDLLTDNNGQYLELQSGRMFNQAASNSNRTPYKHISFQPYATDIWTEYWYPVKDIGAFSKAGKIGALSLTKNGNEVELRFSPTGDINEKLVVYQSDEKIYETSLQSATLKMWKDKFTAKNSQPLKIVIGDNLIVYDENPENIHTKRPQQSPKDFDWNGLYGKYLDGKLWMDQRNYTLAKKSLEACLAEDSNYSPALNLMAVIYYRMGQYDKALEYAKKSLSIDTYDSEGNLIYGLINNRLGNILDAKDGFSVLSYSTTHRLAAYIELIQCFVKENNIKVAARYVEKAKELAPNSQNVLMLDLLVARKQNNAKRINEILDIMDEKYPLNHYTRSENYLYRDNDANKKLLTDNIRSEFPYQTYLELAGWYENMGLYNDAIKVLENAEQNAIVLYRLAYLYHESGNENKAQSTLKNAIDADPSLMLPYRLETLAALKWAEKTSPNWKNKYYLGILAWGTGDEETGKSYLYACNDEPDYAPFYMTRALLKTGKEKELDLLKSEKLDESWRVGYALVNFYNADGNFEKSLEYSQKYTSKYPENYMLALKYGTALVRNDKYNECISLLQKTNVLPNEGAYEGRMIYREANLLSAIENLKLGKYEDALAAIEESKNYIENLGVGKPYDEQIDNRATDYITAMIYEKIGDKSKAAEFYNKVVDANQPMNSEILFTSLAFKKLSKTAEGSNTLNEFIAKSNDKSAAQYCQYIFNGNKTMADNALNALNTGADVAVWQASSKDRSILFTKSIIDKLN